MIRKKYFCMRAAAFVPASTLFFLPQGWAHPSIRLLPGLLSLPPAEAVCVGLSPVFNGIRVIINTSLS